MSPRPKKMRRCETCFVGYAYKPTGVPINELRQVELHRDELEAMRVCDAEGLTQQEAGLRMGVSRGTIQRILTVARRKTATSLTKGYAIIFVSDEE
ncbi:MAG: DNA-binding protein [Proteobacteria bacterium]|nr:MAG: DNA-binding protein [Pseudomonadota bacterium]